MRASVTSLLLGPALAVTLLGGCAGGETKAETATIVGEIVVVGGPYPGMARETAGMVSIRAKGRDVVQLDVPASGRFSANVIPGSYAVEGTLVGGYPCGRESISLTARQTTMLSFACSIR
jgi:hypothetical protein